MRRYVTTICSTPLSASSTAAQEIWDVPGGTSKRLGRKQTRRSIASSSIGGWRIVWRGTAHKLMLHRLAAPLASLWSTSRPLVAPRHVAVSAISSFPSACFGAVPNHERGLGYKAAWPVGAKLGEQLGSSIMRSSPALGRLSHDLTGHFRLADPLQRLSLLGNVESGAHSCGIFG